ncbi:MAG: GMC family oxidoreductase [Myxococcota bacterium]
MTKDRYDLIVAGGGSAGCIVAALAAKAGRHVLLLEAGPDTERHPATLRDSGYKEAFTDDALLWHRFTTRDPRWGRRALFAGTGRGLGGSGSVNAMVYTRGAREDFDEWPEGWNWSDCERAFEAVEQTLKPAPRKPTEWCEAAIGAAESVGFRRSADLNDGDLSNVLGYEAMNARSGERRSSYVAFLRPLRERVTIKTGATADRVLFEGTRAIGVAYIQGGEPKRAYGDEVVLTAGALATPAILQRSGVGAAGHLQSLGIPVNVALPGVGQNLHDHPNVQLFFRGKAEVDCAYPQLYGFARARHDSSLPAGQSDSCYVFYPARSSLREGMMRIVPTMLPPAAYRNAMLRRWMMGAIGRSFYAGPMQRFVERLWGIVVILGKPESRGSLRILSDDARQLPRIDPGYLRHDADVDTLVAGIELARAAARAEAMEPYQGGELFPGPLGRNRDAIERFIRTNFMTTYHYAGTCRMGTDAQAVVDPETLRVHGTDGLRVADASVMPVTPVSALNAPSMMIGHRAATMMGFSQANA